MGKAPSATTLSIHCHRYLALHSGNHLSKRQADGEQKSWPSYCQVWSKMNKAYFLSWAFL